MNPKLGSTTVPPDQACKGMLEVLRGTARAPNDAKYVRCPSLCILDEDWSFRLSTYF